MLGVSESTVRRWCDDGKVPAVRTHGKHRRIECGALLAFARKQGIPVAASAASAAGEGGRIAGNPELATRLYESLVQGDEPATRTLIADIVDHAVAPAAICDEIIAVAMRKIGDDWQSGALPIYQEHAASQTALGVVNTVRSMLASPNQNSPMALCTGLAGDPYALAPAMSALALQAEGYRCLLLGPDTPANELCAALSQHKFALIAISISAVPDEAQLIQDLEAINRVAVREGTRVAVGGRGLHRELRARMTSDFFGDTMLHLATFARRLRFSLLAPSP